jgi:hypothetical protein
MLLLDPIPNGGLLIITESEVLPYIHRHIRQSQAKYRMDQPGYPGLACSIQPMKVTLCSTPLAGTTAKRISDTSKPVLNPALLGKPLR